MRKFKLAMIKPPKQRKYEYKDVLIEIEDANFEFATPMWVTINFDTTLPPVGQATLRKKPNGLYADIVSVQPLSGLYPAIGFILVKNGPTERRGKIKALSVTYQPNTDSRIPPINEPK